MEVETKYKMGGCCCFVAFVVAAGLVGGSFAIVGPLEVGCVDGVRRRRDSPCLHPCPPMTAAFGSTPSTRLWMSE